MATSIQLPADVVDVLTRSTISSDRLVLPPEQLDRKLYESVNKALVAAGGKWNRTAKAHLFKCDPREALGLAVETGELEHRKNTLQAFYTPIELADRLVAAADPQLGERILEPSCGCGALIAAVLRRQPKATVHAIDIDEAAIFEAAALVSSYQNAGIVPSGLQVKLVTADFLDVDPTPIYDAIVMNPPFAKCADIDHVMHAWRFLRPGGRLVSIMSASWSQRGGGRLKKRRAFYEFVEELGGEIDELGGDAFASVGANVHTVLLKLVKP